MMHLLTWGNPIRALSVVLALALTAAFPPPSAAQTPAPIVLGRDWQIQSSARVREGGDAISRPGFRPIGWYPTSVPTTVLAALVANKVYPDPFFGMNLRSIPGTTYPIGSNFSTRPMPADSPFRVSWWYRTEFRLPAGMRGRHLALRFDGINYRANIWLNGRKIAGSDAVAGTYRRFELDITEAAQIGGANALAAEVFPPEPDDLAWTWVDWNPTPPDKNMGLWRAVSVTAGGDVTVRDPHVVSKLDTDTLQRADLTVTAEVRNLTEHPVQGTLRGRIDTLAFRQPVTLAPHETKLVRFTPEQFPALRLTKPRLWWPAEMGPQNLYRLDLEFQTGATDAVKASRGAELPLGVELAAAPSSALVEDAVSAEHRRAEARPHVTSTGPTASDRATLRFGIREVTSALNERGGRLFKINGRPLLIRGGGWAPDMLLRSSPGRQEAELRYVRDMHLNTVRMEGKLEDEHFFDLADEYGILVLAGWCCCDQWERWSRWTPENHTIAAASQRDQIRRLRGHPCLLAWMNGSDNPPPPDVERVYVDILKELDWPNPYLSSATAKRTSVTGATGVKMTGPYDWVPPSYWLLDTTHGGAAGFNSETSPGPAVPPLASLRNMLPAEHLWPIDDHWSYHAGGGPFRDLGRFTTALNARYGTAAGLEDYATKAQLMTYEGERAMFEAYARNMPASTGVIQWMLNNAWPAMIWHLYDYELRPGGGYFGTKKACEPVHVQYSYDDRSVVVLNSSSRPLAGAKVIAKVWNLDLTQKWSQERTLDLAVDAQARPFVIPELEGLSSTYFVDLRLLDAGGQTLSANLYWLSTRPDELDWQRSTWYMTPSRAYADFTALKTLPPVTLNRSVRFTRRGGEEEARVTVTNPGKSLAFFVHLEIHKAAGGEEVLPVRWQDNYFSLLPGETRVITASYAIKDAGPGRAAVSVDGWNVRGTGG